MSLLRNGKRILGIPRSRYGCLRCKIHICQKAECWQDHLDDVLVPTSPIQEGQGWDPSPANTPRSSPPVLLPGGAAEELAASTISVTHDLLTTQGGSEGDQLGEQDSEKARQQGVVTISSSISSLSSLLGSDELEAPEAADLQGEWLF